MPATRIPPFDRLTDAAPHARLLSNGRYGVLLTSAGTGYSSWGGTQLTAWDGDRPRTATGGSSTCAISTAVASGRLAHSRCPSATRSAARYTPGCVALERRVANIESQLNVCVAPDADVEVRAAHAHQSRRAAAPHRGDDLRRAGAQRRAAHAAHPAFSKLFVETELDATSGNAAGAAAAAQPRRGAALDGERAARRG